MKFSVCSLKSHWHKIIIIRHIYCFLHMVCFFQIQLDHFVPMEDALFVQQLRTEKETGNVARALRMGVQGPLYQDNSNKLWQLQGTITLEINFIGIYVLNFIFLSSNILSISLYITAWKMRKLNKSNVLTSTEPINRTLKKKNVEKII